MAKSFVALDPQSGQGQTNTWLTPKQFIDELGPFDLDPCAAPAPRPFPTAKLMNAEADGDGLALDWKGRVWLNPPYGSEAQVWLKKLAEHGNGTALVFARLETKWLQPFIERFGVFLLTGRVTFLRPNGEKATNAGCGSILIPMSRYDLGKILCSNLKGIWLQ